MSKSLKNKNLIGNLVLWISALLFVLIFAFMAAPGFVYKVNIAGQTAQESLSLYKIIFEGEGDNGCSIAAFVFLIIVVVTSLAYIVLKLVNVKIPHEKLVCSFIAVLAIVMGILFFCTLAESGNGEINLGGQITGKATLGAGSIFSGLFGFFGAAGLLTYSFVFSK